MKPTKLVILMYHAVIDAPLEIPDWCFMSKEDFAEQMKFLAGLRRVLPLRLALNSSAAPAPLIAVTFDDGFRNNFENALPELIRFEIPATVFLSTAFVDSRRCLWFCRINRAVATTRLGACHWEGETYDLSTAEARAETSARMQARLKVHPQPRLLDELDRLCVLLGDDNDELIDEHSPYGTLSTQEIESMRDSGLVEFGAHSATHAILSLLDSGSKEREIRQSIDKVGNLIGRPCKLFAYPNGRPSDYDDECITLLRNHGIDAALTATQGVNDETTPKMELRRIGIGADTTLAQFQSLLQSYGCD